MSKLLKIKDWLTLDGAARHLSIVFDEVVTVPDVLQLGLEGRLKLSARFVNPATVRKGGVVELSEAQRVADTSQDPPTTKLKGQLMPDTASVLELDDEVSIIEGVWDLPMIGAERIDLESEYQRLTKGPSVDTKHLYGAFVEGDGYTLYQIQQPFEKEQYSSEEEYLNRDWRQTSHYHPGFCLPPDATLVVRPAALMDLQSSVVGSTKETLVGKERNTVLKLILGMAVSQYKYDPEEAKSAVPKQIETDLKLCGIDITDDTVRKWLSEASDQVGYEVPDHTKAKPK